MSNARNQSLIFASGWTDIAIRSIVAAVVAFVALNVKEYSSAGSFDFAGCGIDGLVVGGFTFGFYAMLALAAPPQRRSSERVPATAR